MREERREQIVDEGCNKIWQKEGLAPTLVGLAPLALLGLQKINKHEGQSHTNCNSAMVSACEE